METGSDALSLSFDEDQKVIKVSGLGSSMVGITGLAGVTGIVGMTNTSLDTSYNSTQQGLNVLNNGIMNLIPVLSNHAAIAFDYIGVTYPTTSSEVYTLVSGGVTGTTLKTFTVMYSDVKKYRVSSVTMV